MTVPDNATGEVWVPTGYLGTGNPTKVGTSAGFDIFDIGPGTTTFADGNTATALVADFDPTQYGHPVTFTATVSPEDSGAGTPTGSVQFSLDGAPAGAPVALAGGVATWMTSTLAIGTHTVSAAYIPDTSAWAASTSASINHSVKKRLATTTAVTSAGPVGFSAPWALTATVSPENAGGTIAPTGSLQLMVDGVALGTPLPIAGGTLTTSDFTITISCTWVPPLRCTILISWTAAGARSAGNHGVRVVYNGDPNYTGSTSPTYTQQVKKASPTGIVVADLPSPIQQTDRPTFTATFTNPVAPAGSLAGNVQFLIDGTNMGAPLAIDPLAGVASFKPTWNLPTGTHTIKAKYLGNANFLAVLSTGLSLKINP